METVLRLLVVDTNSVRPAEQKKAAALAELGHKVTLFAPYGFRENYVHIRTPRPASPPYRLVLGDMVGKPPNRCFFISGMLESFHPKPDVVLVLADENFWLTSHMLVHSLFHAPQTRFFCHSWQNLDFDRNHFPQPNRLLYGLDTFWERRVFKGAAGIMARNREALSVLRRRGYKGRLEYIPWAVDTEHFSPRPRDENGVFTIGYVGRMVPEKGLPELLAAGRMMKSPHRLVLVGGGPMEAEVRKMAADRPDDQVQCISVVEHDKMPQVYSELDALVLPSRTAPFWKEQFGRVLAEAMSCGAALVGSDSGAIPKVVGDAGLVFAEGDAPALAAALDKLASDRNLCRKLGEKGSQRARSLFSWQAWAKSTSRFVERGQSLRRKFLS